MTDIVERLRSWPDGNQITPVHAERLEAAAEIERLREIEKWRDQLFFDMTKDAKIINMLAEHLSLIANMSYEPAASVARAALEAAENSAKDKHS